MLETIELRIPEENAAKFLPDGIGKKITWVRNVQLKSNDPLVSRIRDLQREFNMKEKAFFLGWNIHRTYSQQEIHDAQLFHVWPKRVFEPAAEECGTVYDDAKGCPECGAGAPQINPLFLDGRKIPRNVDFACTIADEWVVSSRVVDLFREQNLSGAEFDPVRLSNQRGAASQNHYQLKVISSAVEVDPATRFGESPFDENSYGRCSRGDVAGLNLLSEVTVTKASLPDADVMATRQLVGVRRGLLRPRPMLLLSPKAWRAIEAAQLKGLTVEIAHLT
jgi:hypothetical protein